jgi:hypothetical protein
MMAQPTGKAGGNEVRFVLPSLPGSVNEIYELNRPDSGLPRRRLKAEWAIWATRMMQHVPLFVIQPMSIVRIDRWYYYPWFYKNGKWRVADVANMDKLLFDTLAKKLGLNDLLFKQGWMGSRDAANGRVVVRLTEIPETYWRAKNNGND